MTNKTLTTYEIFETVQRIDYLNQDEFSEEYCDRSSSYLRTMRSKNYDLPTDVLVNITNKLIEKQQTLTHLAAQDKRLLRDLIETIATMIAKRQTLNEHKKLRAMLLRIVDKLNSEREYNNAPAIVIGF